MRRDETFLDSEYLSEIDEKDQGEYDEGSVFVGMAFGNYPELTNIFEAIVRVCINFDLEATRVSDTPDSGAIHPQILEEIEDAELLIFDLTIERPNVYYELGYAHGVGNRREEIILIAKTGTNIHFDISHLRILYYDDAFDLMNKLEKYLDSIYEPE